MAIAPAASHEIAAFRSLGSIQDLASLLGTTKRQLLFHLYGGGRPSYRVFYLKKASGGLRTIASPPTVIASFQRKLLQCLTAMVVPKDPVHGFVKNRSVVSNASHHVSQEFVLNIDIENFFPSIHFGRVRGIFRNPPFSFPDNVAAVLAQLCCNASSLPQGAPTSPMISNLLCRGLDRDLERFARNHKARYTRYADDITFSTSAQRFSEAILAAPPTLANPIAVLGAELVDIFSKHDLKLNPGKIRLSTRHERQRVTGLIVNNRVNVPRRFIRNIRAILHDCQRNGVAAANARFQVADRKQRLGQPPDVVSHVAGKLDYLRMVRGSDDPLYARLAVGARGACNLFPLGVPISGKATKILNLLSTAVWVVLGLDHNGTEVVQGTAFSLEGVGIVTARHNFNNPANGFAVARWEIRRGSDPNLPFTVTAVHDHPTLDLAVVQATVDPIGVLRVAASPPTWSEAITVVGFPSWYSAADQLFGSQGQVNQLRAINGVNYFITSAIVQEGNSGGPILRSDGTVLGVALYHAAGLAIPNGAIQLDHLAEVRGAPLRPL